MSQDGAKDILKARIVEFMTIWRPDNLYWIPVTHTKETRQAGIMSLGERLGFDDEAAFLELRKRSGCIQFRMWKKHLGTDVTTYEGKTFGVRWIAFGVHIAGPNGWSCCPDDYSRGKGLGKTNTFEFSEPEQCRTAYLPSRPITFPTKIADRLTKNHTYTEHIIAMPPVLISRTTIWHMTVRARSQVRWQQNWVILHRKRRKKGAQDYAVNELITIAR